MRVPKASAWIERCLWIAGSIALGYCAFLWGRANYDQAQGNWELDHLARTSSRTSSAPTGSPEGSLVGRIEIPRLELSAVVFEGTSDDTLARGVGHLKGSATPGARGNVVLAGHRDTFFRELRGIRRGDVVTIEAPEGNSQYRVDSTTIVMPDQTDVVGPSDGATLTLVTCYPFRYIGNAPQRFIVRATKVQKARHSS
jgi:sortase A